MCVRPIAILALTLATLLPAQAPKHPRSRKDRVMEITFTRSGGFAGAATEVTGTIHFDNTGAHVTAEGTPYRHVLPAAEAKHLQSIAAAQLAGPATLPSSNSVRDGYQYDISVKTADGKHRALLLSPDAGPASGLAAWVQQEIQQIWEFRIANRPK